MISGIALFMPAGSWEKKNESQSKCEKNMQKMQNHKASAPCVCDLRESQAQTAPGLISDF
jgi:hypothetical protein